jgi:hypothetical protein
MRFSLLLPALFACNGGTKDVSDADTDTDSNAGTDSDTAGAGFFSNVMPNTGQSDQHFGYGETEHDQLLRIRCRLLPDSAPGEQLPLYVHDPNAEENAKYILELNPAR